MCTPSVSNMNYHKFSHGAAFCVHNGKNFYARLELEFKVLLISHCRNISNKQCKDEWVYLRGNSFTILPFFSVGSTLNPIALIKAKIVYNFGLYECSRVKEKELLIHSFKSRLHVKELSYPEKTTGIHAS